MAQHGKGAQDGAIAGTVSLVGALLAGIGGPSPRSSYAAWPAPLPLSPALLLQEPAPERCHMSAAQ